MVWASDGIAHRWCWLEGCHQTRRVYRTLVRAHARVTLTLTWWGGSPWWQVASLYTLTFTVRLGTSAWSEIGQRAIARASSAVVGNVKKPSCIMVLVRALNAARMACCVRRVCPR